MDFLGPLLYVLLKLGAYIGWCILGVRLHGHRERILRKGIAYGALRAAMGAVLGLFLILQLVGIFQQATQNEIVLYVAIYVPVRWIEWSLMAVLIDPGHRSVLDFLVGQSPTSRLWRLGGIVLSCLADLPVLITMHHLPIGRFLC